ncbi:MAG: DNA recombination protein RmuC [Bacteroidota bacterium]
MNEIYLIIALGSVVLILISTWLTSKLSSRKMHVYLKDELIRIDKSFRDELSRNREETSMVGKFQREELSNAIKLFGDQFFDQLSKLIQTNEQMFDKLQNRVESQLKEIQENNSKKLEEMRHTVDEKLHSTLEKRLGESFKLVSERLEQVYKGLGDMQELARGVGDLKNVLANVKTRGGWGEIQLENLIEQILTRDQYEKNVSVKKGSNDKVEIAIKLPGRNESKDDIVWLPIDAKFPVEDYQRLLEAQETNNAALINEAQKSIEARIKSEAKKIAEKYIAPPQTTDFAIMFLPIEGLYAEILRRPGIAEILQREYRVTISGPTTLTALLNSLQMGFRTLAIEKRSSEVWKVLGSVKNEFGTFGNLLEKTQKKLQEASNTIDEAAKSTRKIEKHLNKVQELPSSEQTELL